MRDAAGGGWKGLFHSARPAFRAAPFLPLLPMPRNSHPCFGPHTPSLTLNAESRRDSAIFLKLRKTPGNPSLSLPGSESLRLPAGFRWGKGYTQEWSEEIGWSGSEDFGLYYGLVIGG
jgi:hypothetical protein